MKHFYLIFSFLFASNLLTAQTSLNTGLVASYPFSGNANDASGNGFNGIVNNATLTSDRFGNANSAYSFDGTTSSIDLGNNFNSTIAGVGNKFSISVWINPNSSTDNMIFAKSADAGCSEDQRQFFIRLYNGMVEVEYFGDLTGNSGRFITANTSLSNGNWVNVVVTYDGTINTNDGLDRVKIYVGGVMQTTSFQRTSVGTLGSIVSGTAHAGIGATLTSTGTVCNSGANFNGEIDELKIYNRVLTQCEAVQLGNTPLASYPFDGNANDASGNGFDGTVSNATLTTDRFGNSNSAYSFNDSTSFITLGDVFDNYVAGTNKVFSISAWIKPKANTNQAIVTKLADAACSADQREFLFRLYNGKLEFEYFGALDGTSGRFVGGSTNINNFNKWYHVVVVYHGNQNGNDGLDRVQLYVDNVLENVSFARTSVGTLGDIQNGSAPVAIGAYLLNNSTLCSSSTVFSGSIDDVNFFQDTLTSCEVNALFVEGGTVTSIFDPSEDQASIVAFPNPTDGKFTITGLEPGVNVEIMNAVGIKLDSYQLTDSSIDLSKYINGLYLIKLSSGNESKVLKVYKK